MNITLFTDYSLRTLIYLAIQEQELSTIKQIADSYNISKNHLMKVVQTLNSQGYIKAIRGKNGGIKLNQKPQQINIGEIVRLLEQDSKLVECFGDDNQCIITPACQLKNILSEAMEAFFKALDRYTLSDLIKPKHQAALNSILLSEIVFSKDSTQ